MKRFIMFMVMAFVLVMLFVSCGTTRGKPKYWEQYLEDKQKYFSKIEADLAKDVRIDLSSYVSQIARTYGQSVYGDKNPYYEDFVEDVYNKYESIVASHNNEYARRQKQKDDEWVRLSMKKIPGSRDWEIFQSRYNLKQIYSSMTHESNSVNRLRLEMLEKEMSAYIKEKNLVFTEEQSAWYKNVMECLTTVAFALNVNFGMSERDFQSYLSQSLAKLNRYTE